MAQKSEKECSYKYHSMFLLSDRGDLIIYFLEKIVKPVKVIGEVLRN